MTLLSFFCFLLFTVFVGIDMQDRALYGLSFISLLVFGFALNGFGKSPPNIVMFLVDDLGAAGRDQGCRELH